MNRSQATSAAPRFTRPLRQILLILVICGLVGFGGALVYPGVAPVFLASPFLNGIIAAVFIVGVAACFWQLLQLFSSVAWIERVAANHDGRDNGRAPRLLAPLSAVFRGRGARMQLTSASSRSILDSVGQRMEESRDITRYIANLLIFLGLLGTFFGLATTVPAVVETIRSLQPTEGEEGIVVFTRLMNGLEDQLGGMGTAFASSLLGLAGSLVVGLLELFAGHGQNRFYREMEEWLSTITRVGFSSGDGDGGGVDRGAIATVLDHMLDQMDTLQSLFSQSEARRADTEARMVELLGAVGALTDRLGAGPVEATEHLASAQDRLAKVLATTRFESGIDTESQLRLRSIDVQLLKILEEMGARRQDDVGALRGELRALTAALKQLMHAADSAPPAQQTPPGGE
ncbi:MAG: biopolymer transporter ExbB [Rhodobacteraceae bacterium]|nr:biopolymer transporter ExbB [Paracoccaceae bacterium]